MVQCLIDRLLADRCLRADFARDPLATAIRLGVDVDDSTSSEAEPTSPDAPGGVMREER